MTETPTRVNGHTGVGSDLARQRRLPWPLTRGEEAVICEGDCGAPCWTDAGLAEINGTPSTFGDVVESAIDLLVGLEAMLDTHWTAGPRPTVAQAAALNDARQHLLRMSELLELAADAVRGADSDDR